MKKRLLYLLLAICFVLQTQVVFASSVTMYSADGRELIVAESEVEAQKTVGWFTAPPVLMYSADGRQLLVSGDEIEPVSYTHLQKHLFLDTFVCQRIKKMPFTYSIS